MKHRQAGFTLVEIAIVLVIIGLLLGGIIQGQQLINSARVKNLAETNSGVQAAYFGFIDRYRQVPGDMDNTVANNAIGVTINGGGNGNIWTTPRARDSTTKTTAPGSIFPRQVSFRVASTGPGPLNRTSAIT